MHLSCEKGVIAVNPNYTKFGLVWKKQSLKELVYTFYEKCTNYTNVMESLQSCIGNSYCAIHLDRSWVYQTCLKKAKKLKGVLSVFCKDVKLSLFGMKRRSIAISLIPYLFLSALIIVLFLYYIFW